jgi:gamma-butyrobetaine dioxygenase
MPTLHITSPAELCIEMADGQRFAIHPLWLRERCQDEATIDVHTGQRLLDPSDLDPRLSLRSVTRSGAGRLLLRFSDGHEAQFSDAEILAEAALAIGDEDVPAPRLWDASLQAPARLLWNPAAADAQIAGWLLQFLQLGFVVFTGVPIRPGYILELAATFGFPRVTNFGALFDVRSVPAAIDLAYTAVGLDAHTDNPYRDPVPGVQLLHCLRNETSGGLSTLVDGFAAAEALRRRDPAAFQLLTGISVRFRYRDAETELVASAPLIELDVAGRLRAVHFSPRLDYVPLLPPAQLAEYYRARREFDRLLRAPEFELRFLLASGELMMMDNRRLLHGRTGFDPAEGMRHLQGCYIDIDGPRSRYRVLRRQLALREHAA